MSKSRKNNGFWVFSHTIKPLDFGIWQQHINLVPLNLNLNHINFIRHIGVLLLALMNTAEWAKTVSGTVSDENNQPLPRATVIVRGTTTGSSTDYDGKYQINATQGQTLVFSR